MDRASGPPRLVWAGMAFEDFQVLDPQDTNGLFEILNDELVRIGRDPPLDAREA